MRPRALDLYCGGGGVSEGLLLAGFEVVGVDLDPKREKAYMRGPGNPERHERPAVFVRADALQALDAIITGRAGPLPMGEAWGHFDFIWASPPCQKYSGLRHLVSHRGEAYPDLVGPNGKAKTISVTGATPQRQEVHNVQRETFSTDDARHAMGIDWMAMRDLSQAIPPAYAEWLGRQAMDHLEASGAK